MFLHLQLLTPAWLLFVPQFTPLNYEGWFSLSRSMLRSLTGSPLHSAFWSLDENCYRVQVQKNSSTLAYCCSSSSSDMCSLASMHYKWEAAVMHPHSSDWASFLLLPASYMWLHNLFFQVDTDNRFSPMEANTWEQVRLLPLNSKMQVGDEICCCHQVSNLCHLQIKNSA